MQSTQSIGATEMIIGQRIGTPLVSPRRGNTTTLIVAVWAGVAIAGLGALASYQYTEGEAHTAPQTWPSASRLQITPGRPTLVMFAHPKCPCTRASISELSRVMTRCRDLVRAHVVFVQPDETSGSDWQQTDLVASAKQIPGVNVSQDLGGIEAARFHAATSGWVLLYGKRGQLRFCGGITGSRGHHGDNAGRSAVMSYLSTGDVPTARTDVYGCALHGRDASSGTVADAPCEKCSVNTPPPFTPLVSTKSRAPIRAKGNGHVALP